MYIAMVYQQLEIINNPFKNSEFIRILWYSGSDNTGLFTTKCLYLNWETIK